MSTEYHVVVLALLTLAEAARRQLGVQPTVFAELWRMVAANASGDVGAPFAEAAKVLPDNPERHRQWLAEYAKQCGGDGR